MIDEVIRVEKIREYFGTDRATVTLPGVDIKASLPPSTCLRYDGEVPSLAEHIALTELIIQGKIEPKATLWKKILYWAFDQSDMGDVVLKVREKLAGIDDLAAYCYSHKVDGHNAFVIAKKRGLPRNASIFADGHESGEFLDETGQQHLLQEAVDDAGINLDVNQYQDEDFADIGGLLALLKAIRKGEKDIALPIFRTREQISQLSSKAFGF